MMNSFLDNTHCLYHISWKKKEKKKEVKPQLFITEWKSSPKSTSIKQVNSVLIFISQSTIFNILGFYLNYPLFREI